MLETKEECNYDENSENVKQRRNDWENSKNWTIDKYIWFGDRHQVVFQQTLWFTRITRHFYLEPHGLFVGKSCSPPPTCNARLTAQATTIGMR